MFEFLRDSATSVRISEISNFYVSYCQPHGVLEASYAVRAVV